MRTVKFRAWDKKLKGFHYWDSKSQPENNIFWAMVKAENMPLTQYTGLKNKTKKEVYENDIIECSYDNGKAIVKYSEHFAKMSLFFFGNCRKDLKTKLGVGIFDWIYPEMESVVIGNIYENPELLK